MTLMLAPVIGVSSPERAVRRFPGFRAFPLRCRHCIVVGPGAFAWDGNSRPSPIKPLRMRFAAATVTLPCGANRPAGS